MVGIKEAVQEAIAFARETLGAERTGDIRLEEMESANVNGADAWLITLSRLNALYPLSSDVFSKSPSRL